MVRFFLTVFAIFISFEITIFPANAQQKTPSQPIQGGTLIVAIDPEPSSLTATFNNQYSNRTISANIFDGLLTYDNKYLPQPQLAQSWTISPDGKSITFKLRPGVKWHDGQPFTSKDVRYSALEVWKKVHSRGRSTFATVTDVETPDPLTAIFRLSAPSLVILNAFDGAESQVLPAHIFEGKDIRTNPAASQPIGTGPFKFKKWERGQYVELVRNPDYWDKGKPHLNRVIYRFIPDASARSAALESGDVSYVPFAGVPFSDIARLKRNPNLAFDFRGYSYAAQTYFLAFNLRNKYLAQQKVRQAFAHVIDRQRLIDTVWYGQSKPEYSVIPSSLTRYFTNDIPHYKLDINKANQLLDEAGFKLKADGTRFTLRLFTDPASSQALLVGEFLRQALSKVGVILQYTPLDNATFTRRIYTDYDFDVVFQGWGIMLDPQMGLTRVYNSKAQTPGVPYANAFAYNNPAMDAIIHKYQRESDPEKRVEYFHDFQRLALTDLPLIPIMQAPFFTAWNRKLHGVDLSPAGAHSGFRNAWLAP